MGFRDGVAAAERGAVHSPPDAAETTVGKVGASVGKRGVSGVLGFSGGGGKPPRRRPPSPRRGRRRRYSAERAAADAGGRGEGGRRPVGRTSRTVAEGGLPPAAAHRRRRGAASAAGVRGAENARSKGRRPIERSKRGCGGPPPSDGLWPEPTTSVDVTGGMGRCPFGWGGERTRRAWAIYVTRPPTSVWRWDRPVRRPRRATRLIRWE